MSKENLEAEFQRYKKEHEGEPFDFETTEGAKRELLLDALHKRPEYDRQSPDRETIIAGVPEGKLFDVEIANEDIPKAIERLTTARKDLATAMDFGLFGNSRDKTFAWLKETRGGDRNEKTLSGRVNNAIEAITTYMDIDPETSLYDIPSLIQELLSRLARKQDRLRKESAN
jgi:hypothetical protein